MLIVSIGLLGLCVGSFINAFVWRLHEQQFSAKKTKKQQNELSITTGRSMCPECKHTLGVFDLLPVLSWVLLRAKCRYCNKPIHWQYPLVELATAALFVGSYLWWPYGFEPAGAFQFAMWLVILAGFIVLTIYDLRWMLLPNKVVYSLSLLALFQVVVLSVAQQSLQPLIGGLLGVLFLFGLFYALFQASAGRWIGGGDVKLAIALGLLVGGPLKSILVLFLASLIGTFVSVPKLLVSGNKNKHIPFGPFLMLATSIVYFFGSSMIEWYTNLLLG